MLAASLFLPFLRMTSIDPEVQRRFSVEYSLLFTVQHYSLAYPSIKRDRYSGKRTFTLEIPTSLLSPQLSALFTLQKNYPKLSSQKSSFIQSKKRISSPVFSPTNRKMSSTSTFFALGLLALVISCSVLVMGSPLQQQQSQQQQQSSSDENNGAVDSIVLSRNAAGNANPFLEKALQRAR